MLRFTAPDALLALLTLFMVLFLAFINLETLPIREWDESRQANSALEMYRDGMSVVATYEGEPDLWNTKPPTLVWIQVFFMHIVGPSELAVRLPSAIAVVLSCLFLAFFGKRLTDQWYFGALIALVLIAIPGYNGEHTGRTGDYDAPLALLMMMAAWMFFLVTHVQYSKPKYWYFFFAFLAMGVWIKGVAPLMMGPALAIWLLTRKGWLSYLNQRAFYLGTLLFIVLTSTIYLWREAVMPGFLNAVWENELGGRYANTLDLHKHGFWWYWENLYNYRSGPFFFLALSGYLVSLLSSRLVIRQAAHFSMLFIIAFLIVISGSATKLWWYDNPVYPFVAFLVASGLWELITRLRNALFSDVPEQKSLTLLWLLVVVLALWKPLASAVNEHYKPVDKDYKWSLYALPRLLQTHLKKGPEGVRSVAGYTVVQERYDAHVLFYIQALRLKGYDLKHEHYTQIIPGDSILSWTDNTVNYIETNFEAELLWEESFGAVKAYLIKDESDSTP